MIFNSYAFLAFFPIVTLAYYLMPMRARRPWLLAASYYFYMCWNAQYALLIAASTLVTYLCALALGRMEAKTGRRAVLALGLAINLGILCFFKYFGFFTDTFARIAARLGVRLAIPAFDVLLPVGISFYTFQALGYMIDVYRGKLPPERSLMRYALFVSFFPQLVAGPIERSENLLRQVNEDHPLDEKAVRDGLLVMLLGFFEKLVIADRASLYVDAVYGNWQQASGLQILLATVAFAFQIYGDFGGYSHIAIGATAAQRTMRSAICSAVLSACARKSSHVASMTINVSSAFAHRPSLPRGSLNRRGRKLSATCKAPFAAPHAT